MHLHLFLNHFLQVNFVPLILCLSLNVLSSFCNGCCNPHQETKVTQSITISSTNQHSLSSSSLFSLCFPHILLTSLTNHFSPKTKNSFTPPSSLIATGATMVYKLMRDVINDVVGVPIIFFLHSPMDICN